MAAKKTAKKAAAKKSAAKTPAKTAAAKAPKSPKAPKAEKKSAPPSPDAIAKGAYLNYRRRVEQGLPGDSHGDWIEAERQLRETADSA